MALVKDVIVLILLSVSAIRTDKSCNARQEEGQSVVCVCNASFCDDITREMPEVGHYRGYVSSAAGSRFKKIEGLLEDCDSSKNESLIELDHVTTYQTILGFGGAVTDAAGINWKSLSKPLQDEMIKTYFSKSGLEYTFIRVPIGGSDFSTRAYAYNELPENDTHLTNYTLAPEDFQYKIPMIQAAMDVALPKQLKLIATVWSPPAWLKTSHKLTGFGQLLPEYYQTYADYHLKFIEQYSDNGIPIWGITTTNEPLNGLIPDISFFNSLGWFPTAMGTWIVENLSPTIRGSKFNSTKILTMDDQRYAIPLWLDFMLYNKKVLEAIDGVAVHYYGDSITPASLLTSFSSKHPDKLLIMTEACEGSFPWEHPKVLLGSWKRASHYISDIISNLNHDVQGWIDWNLCLNKEGSPNWAKNYVDSPIIVFPETKEFVKQPMFYAIGHFSKFIPSGSRRIALKSSEDLGCCIEQLAVVTPNNTTVVVIWNKKGVRKISLKSGSKHAVLNLEAESITTVKMPLN